MNSVKLLFQDLIPAESRIDVFSKKKQEVLHFEAGTKLRISRVFGTSIWDETLYKVCFICGPHQCF